MAPARSPTRAAHGLTVRGTMGYEGHAVLVPDGAERLRRLTDESMAILARPRSRRRADPLRRRHRHVRREHRCHRDPSRLLRADGHRVREARHPVRARARSGRDRDPRQPEVVRGRLRAQGAGHGPRQPHDRRRRGHVLLRRARDVHAASPCASATACSCGPRTSIRPWRTTTRCTSPTVRASMPP